MNPEYFMQYFNETLQTYIPIADIEQINLSTKVIFPHMFLSLKNIRNEILYAKNFLSFL